MLPASYDGKTSFTPFLTLSDNLNMSGRAGGKQKPLKAAKRPEKELDDDDKVKQAGAGVVPSSGLAWS